MKFTALSVAGFDGSGGAGIQADLKVFDSLGGYGLSAVTAVAVQNTQGVSCVYPIEASCVHQQLDALFSDFTIDVIKIGMLHRPEIVSVVAIALSQRPRLPVVIDPVMTSTGGHQLTTFEGVAAMEQLLFPLATLITPNIAEAEVLLKRPIRNKGQIEKAALDLQYTGAKAVLVKGGHLKGDYCDDCLSWKGIHWFSVPRVATRNTHGTGCVYAAAIAAYLARGLPIENAVLEAKKYLTSCLQHNVEIRLGHGHGPVYRKRLKIWQMD